MWVDGGSMHVAIPVPVLVVSFALACALLALWCDARLGRFAPASLKTAVLHVIASVVVTQLATVPLQSMLESGEAKRTMTAIFAIALPAIVYSFVAALWIIKVCQRMFSEATR
jgi:hypothetical protein